MGPSAIMKGGFQVRMPVTDAENPGAADESATPGFLYTGESLVPLGSVYALRRAGSTSLARATRPCDTVSLARDLIDCGQLPRSRLTLSELSSELLSKGVRFESDVVAVSRPLCC